MSTPLNSHASWFSMFSRGQHYSKTWPVDKRLAPVFVENRVIRATRFAIRFMPPLAVFTLTWQIALGGQLGPAVATASRCLAAAVDHRWRIAGRGAARGGVEPTPRAPWPCMLPMHNWPN